MNKRGASILGAALAMGVALAWSPTFAHKSQSVNHQTYRTPPPVVNPATPVPKAPGHPSTGAGGTAPLVGQQPSRSSAPSYGGVPASSTSSTSKPASLPSTGGAAR